MPSTLPKCSHSWIWIHCRYLLLWSKNQLSPEDRQAPETDGPSLCVHVVGLETHGCPHSSVWTTYSFQPFWATLVAQTVKNLPAMQKTWVQALCQEDPLEKEMATHSSILAWKSPRTEEPDGLQSMELQRVRHDWSNYHFHICQTFYGYGGHCPWAPFSGMAPSSSLMGLGPEAWIPSLNRWTSSHSGVNTIP